MECIELNNLSKEVKRIFSPKEITVLSLMAIGLSDNEISGELTTSLAGVHSHIQSLYKKINETNRFQVILWCAKNL